MGLRLTHLRRKYREFLIDGVRCLESRPDGAVMDPAYIVVLAEKDVPYDQDGFIAVRHYTPDTAIPHEVGALEAFRFIVDESAAAPVFLRSVDDYALYPATRINHK